MAGGFFLRPRVLGCSSFPEALRKVYWLISVLDHIFSLIRVDSMTLSYLVKAIEKHLV